jgi:RimJ/RimL family protein N-acetyltransferase
MPVTAMLAHLAATTDLRSVVLDIETTNAPSLALARRLGAQERRPPRTEADRSGVPRTFTVFVLGVAPGPDG